MRIAILGAGQLGRMLALAGYPLGLSFTFFDPTGKSCAAQLAPSIVATYNDQKKLAEMAAQVDLVTFEFENVPLEAVRFLQKLVVVRPALRALEVTQDRLLEKNLFKELAIPTPQNKEVDSSETVKHAIDTVGLPMVFKTRRLGYDGKGQIILHNRENIPDLWEMMQGKSMLAEKLINFDREVSLIAVRSVTGETLFYPLSENVHEQGILRRTICRTNDPCQQQAEIYVHRILDALQYVGVLTVEFFEVNGQLLANEIAPRVHNSGHWTIEGAVTSQFENHLRAIIGWPVGSTNVRQHVGMVNIIGDPPQIEDILQIPDAHLHLYGKKPAVGRKAGHITLLAPQMQQLVDKMNNLVKKMND